MRGTLAAGIVVCAALAAEAEEPAPAAREPVLVKLAVKVGDVFRFRHVESSATEVNGATYSGQDLVHEYAITVKALRPDGGADVELRFESVSGKLPARGGAAAAEFSSKTPAAADADPKTKLLTTFAAAETSAPFGVTLDAHGAVTAVSGLRECRTKALAGTPFATAFDPAVEFSDARLVEEISPLFAASPAEPHAVGAAWTADVSDSVSQTKLDFAAKFAVSIADAEKVVVAAKYDWKPGKEALAGAKSATGGGSVAVTFSRKDGLPLKATKKLTANRDAQVTATSRTTHTIERMESAPPVKPKTR